MAGGEREAERRGDGLPFGKRERMTLLSCASQLNVGVWPLLGGKKRRRARWIGRCRGDKGDEAETKGENRRFECGGGKDGRVLQQWWW